MTAAGPTTATAAAAASLTAAAGDSTSTHARLHNLQPFQEHKERTESLDAADHVSSRDGPGGDDDEGDNRSHMMATTASRPLAAAPLNIAQAKMIQADPEATPTGRWTGFPDDDNAERDRSSFGPLRSGLPYTADDNGAGPSTLPFKPERTRRTRQTTVKPVSMASLRAKVCKAAATGDLDALIALLHPFERVVEAHDPDDGEAAAEVNDDPDYPSSFALVNSPTSSGLTPLLEAASRGHLAIVKHLIEEEGAVRDLEDVEGENAFLKASYRGHLDVMKYLHNATAVNEDEGGTDVNCADREGWTAMHNAAGKGYLEVVMWLGESGAEVDARSRQGYTVRPALERTSQRTIADCTTHT